MLVSQINNAAWDEENDIAEYSAAALRSYLLKQDTIFLTCHKSDGEEAELLGMASARLEQKPYRNLKWMYVDEVDVCSNHRGKGVGTALMNRLMEIGKENSCFELWLGAESKNTPANKFYAALNPDGIDECIGYTFELESN